MKASRKRAFVNYRRCSQTGKRSTNWRGGINPTLVYVYIKKDKLLRIVALDPEERSVVLACEAVRTEKLGVGDHVFDLAESVPHGLLNPVCILVEEQVDGAAPYSGSV
jgi:hypothetical protein